MSILSLEYISIECVNDIEKIYNMKEEQLLIKAAQSFLKSHNWYSGDIDGIVGKKTREALFKYKSSLVDKPPVKPIPEPTPPVISPPILPTKPPEKLPSMNKRVAFSLEILLFEINNKAPNRSKTDDGWIGDSAHANRKSDHNPCPCHDKVCARDFTHDPKGGFDSYIFADWLVDRMKKKIETRVKYIISNGRIASGPNNEGHEVGIWRKYSGSNKHDQHVHVSVRHPKEIFDNTDTWGWLTS